MSPSSEHQSAPTVLFAGHPDFELQAPSQCDWARTRFVRVEEGWDRSIEEMTNISADVCILFNPEALTLPQLQRIPGTKMGVLTREYSADQLRQFAKLTLEGGFRWFTSPAPALKAQEFLPVLQTLPPLVDTARLPSSPAFGIHSSRILGSRDSNLPRIDGIERLRGEEGVQAVFRALQQTGVVLSSADAGEYAELLALALGQLLIRDRELPPHWGFEQEDEYLVRAPGEWTKTLAEVDRAPGRFRPVRIRAWQKVREMFDASSVFERLVHDARWFDATVSGTE